MIFYILSPEMRILGRIIGFPRKGTHHGRVRCVVSKNRKSGFQLIPGLMEHVAHGKKDKYKKHCVKNAFFPEKASVRDPSLCPGGNGMIFEPRLPGEKQNHTDHGQDQNIGIQQGLLHSALDMDDPGCKIQTPCGQKDPAAKSCAKAQPECVHRTSSCRILIKQDAGQLQSNEERRQHVCDRRHNDSPSKIHCASAGSSLQILRDRRPDGTVLKAQLPGSHAGKAVLRDQLHLFGDGLIVLQPDLESRIPKFK